MRAALSIAATVAGLTGCMASPPSAEPVPSPAKSPRAGRPWAPAPRTPWQWQLTTPVDQSVNAPVYDIDGFENSAEVVRALHGQNRRVICYVNVGAAEDFRPDYRAFPAGVLGKRNGWAGERWLDIRRLDVLGPVMAKRLNMCQAKGFDAVEPDLVEGYTASTGFPLAAADQLRYNRFIARLAHERGMSVGLKNDLGQIPSLLKDFDFAVSEECAQFRECHLLSPFIKTGKAVLHVEYKLPTEKFCAQTKALGFSSMRKRLALGTWRQPC